MKHDVAFDFFSFGSSGISGSSGSNLEKMTTKKGNIGRAGKTCKRVDKPSNPGRSARTANRARGARRSSQPADGDSPLAEQSYTTSEEAKAQTAAKATRQVERGLLSESIVGAKCPLVA